jgi:hypothetical protein
MKAVASRTSGVSGMTISAIVSADVVDTDISLLWGFVTTSLDSQRLRASASMSP